MSADSPKRFGNSILQREASRRPCCSKGLAWLVNLSFLLAETISLESFLVGIELTMFDRDTGYDRGAVEEYEQSRHGSP